MLIERLFDVDAPSLIASIPRTSSSCSKWMGRSTWCDVSTFLEKARVACGRKAARERRARRSMTTLNLDVRR
jgi:hypothetical protein